MAAKSAKTASSEPSGGKGGKGGLMVPLLVVTLVGGGAGFAFAKRELFLPAPGAEKPAASAASAEEGHGHGPAPAPASAPAELALLELPAIVTNLGEPSDVWIRLEASVLVDPSAAASSEALRGFVADDLLAYLRTLSLDQIQGATGFHALRDAIAERARIRSDGKITAVLIRTMVIQ
jgi:flagellar FliL protein